MKTRGQRYSPEEVEHLLQRTDLTRWQIYALQHQHPLNQACHAIGIPLILVGLAWPLVAWFMWGVLAWQVWLACQVVGWFFQLLGHRLEGNNPSFVSDPYQLLIGPAFFFTKPVRWWRGEPDVSIGPAA